MRKVLFLAIVGVGVSTGVWAQEVAPVDTLCYKELRQVVVIGYYLVRKKDWTICYTTIKPDTLGGAASAADTMAALGFSRVREELAVYPNPVRAGMLATLSWEGVGAGEYEVGLFTAAGALVERQVIVVGSKAQVNLIKIPASLAKGVYVLRVAKAGEVRVLSRKLAVL